MSEQGDFIIKTLRQWADDFSTDEDRDVFIAAADEIERLRNIAIERMDLFKQAANNVERLDAEIARLRVVKTATLKIADERAKEAVELRAQLAKKQTADEAETFAWVETINDRRDQELTKLSAKLASARKALEAAKGFADEEFSDCGDLNRKNRISRLCDKIDAALTDEKGES